MVEAVESYTTYDGKIFLSEESAIRHEAVERLCEILPELRLIRPRLDCNLNAIANAVGPISAYGSRVPYEGPIEDPIIVDHGELAGTCSCSAGMNGALDHARDCPSYHPGLTLAHG